MRPRTAKPTEMIQILKIALMDYQGRTKGYPYRVLALPDAMSLYHLAEAIVTSFNFDFDHAFGFYDNLKNSFESQEGYELFADMGEESDFPGTKNTRIAKVFDEVGKKMLFLFDYGDEWRFKVELQKIVPAIPSLRYPQIAKSVGKAPAQYDYGDEDGDEEEEPEN